jgi:hypothetical protein
MTKSIAWDKVTNTDVVQALQEYDRLGPDRFFSEHGFAPTTTYELIWEERRYPPKAILGTAYELATGRRLDEVHPAESQIDAEPSPAWPGRTA